MKKLSIIWDITNHCPFNCPICCMGANPKCQGESDELDLELKYTVIEQLRELGGKREIRMDVSGGEIMTDLRNLDIVEGIAKIIGKKNVGVSTSGYGIHDGIAYRLSSIAGEVELTMDTPPGVPSRLRPLEYARTAARAVPLLKKYSVYTGIQTVLARSNCSKNNLTQLYRWLCQNRVDEWSLLRFYPSGRGANFQKECLAQDELMEVVRMLQELDADNASSEKPALHIHYTIKGHRDYTQECRCVKKSIGIFPNGDVTACFWACDQESHISKDLFRLGNVRTQTLTQILESPRANYWQDQPHVCPLIAAGKEEGHVFDIQHYDCIA